jgi:hypothetical protein
VLQIENFLVVMEALKNNTHAITTMQFSILFFFQLTMTKNQTTKQKQNLVLNQNSETKNHNFIPKLLGIQQRKPQIIYGGSNHALDAMLESEMQNRETQNNG